MDHESVIRNLLAKAEIEVNGCKPWDIHVLNKGFYRRVLCQGSLGLGNSYVDGWWDVPALDEFFFRVLRAGLDKEKEIGIPLAAIPLFIRSVVFNPQRLPEAFVIGRRHYDLGNDLFRAMLGKRMVYSCGYWEKGAINLDQAQEAKLELTCQKLDIRKNMTVLDIGCGWGGLARYAAERYGASVVGVTVSEEQVELAKKRTKGWPVEIRLQDYRDLTGKFDRIVSLGMFEHVGYKNYRTFMKVAERLLTDDGLMLLHTIGSDVSVRMGDPWTEENIFPNSMLPSIAQIGRAIEGLFVMEDWHNFSADYDRTLMAWFQNFDSHWFEMCGYGEPFYRMWKYYLLSFAGSFRARRTQLWQIVLSKRGVLGGHRSIR